MAMPQGIQPTRTMKAAASTSSSTSAATAASKVSKPDFPKAFAKAAADTLKKAPLKAKATKAVVKPTPSQNSTSNLKSRGLEYRNLIDPKTQDQRKAHHLEAFEKLKNLSIDDLQVEFIVCIRAGKKL